VPVVPTQVNLGDVVEARDGELGTVKELFQGPPRSAQGIFFSSEPYMEVVDRGQPDLFIPMEEVVDVSDVKQRVYLKRRLDEIDALGWTADPRVPGSTPIPYFPTRRTAPPSKTDAQGGVAPRPLTESGKWTPGPEAPRAEPGRGVRIGDRFKPGDVIPIRGQYMCTVCRFRKHSRQMLADNPEGRFPPPHHPDALWELEDLRP